jgi:hypothetical protein
MQLMKVPEPRLMRQIWISCARITDRGFSWVPSSFFHFQDAGICQRGSVGEEDFDFSLAPHNSFTISAPSQLTESVFSCILHGKKYFIKGKPNTEDSIMRRPEISCSLSFGPPARVSTIFPMIVSNLDLQIVEISLSGRTSEIMRADG